MKNHCLKMVQSRRTIKEILMAVTVILVGTITTITYQLYRPVDFYATAVTDFTIAHGESPSQIATRLGEAGLIRSPRLFYWYARLTWQAGDFQAGRYTLAANQSIPTLVRMFAEGRAESSDIGVLIYEGMNLADIDKLLAQNKLIRLGELLTPANLALEGQWFPDTYRFWPTVTDSAGEIKTRLLDNFAAKTVNLQANHEAAGTDFKRALIIASLLEKEVPKIDEMRMVAGVIENRLKQGMKLQIDSTTGYAVCLPKFQKGQYCDVSQANIAGNLTNPSPYNTYVHTGLPPGPITNPGLRAIEAALNPLPSQYYYYLSTRDGRTIFSKIGAEHEANRRRYLGR